MRRPYIYILLTLLFVLQGYGQINWTKYESNPVFEGQPGQFDSDNTYLPTIVFHDNQYHMWYTGFGGGAGSRIGYAVSDDGITWDRNPGPVLQTGSAGAWDDYSVQVTSVIYKDSTWHMWYSGYNGDGNFSFQIGYATSTDKINWTKYEGNPILGPGSAGAWDEVYAGWPEVLLIDDVYHMWYCGRNASLLNQIGHATSPDGISWEKDAMNPVLSNGAAGAWDDITVAFPHVYYDGNSFHMWYGGAQTVYGNWELGYAVSADGSNWQRISTDEPVMEVGSAGQWDEQYVADGVEIIVGDTLKMWYAGGNGTNVGKIGYATGSWEPIPLKNTWYKHPLNPVFKGESGEFDSQVTQHPSIVVHDNQYHMWYSGYDGGDGSRVGYAVSDDGISWERHPDPVMQTGSAEAWDNYSVQGTSVLYKDSTWHMWYTGLKDGNLTTTRIGYATSKDKINWTKYENNPVLENGPISSWDVISVGWPKVLFIDGLYHMWYTGRDGSINQIGHATSADGISWEKDPANPVLTVGASGAWDDLNVWNPDVHYDGDSFHLWYGGARTTYGDWKVGYAVSLDGSSWQKISTDEPVLDIGSIGKWDSKYVGAGVVIMVEEDRSLKMWYGGGNGTNIGWIGYAATALDHTPPASPTNVLATYHEVIDSIITVTWDNNTEKDLSYYTVYRSVCGLPSVKIAQVSDTFYVDNNLVEGCTSVYSVSASDSTGNESDRIEVNVTSVNQISGVPLKFSLSQNYPNPFNPKTTINYTVGANHDSPAYVNLSIYNLLGQKVATLVDKKQQAGSYSIEWLATGFASGVYFYRLETNTGFIQSRKLLLLK